MLTPSLFTFLRTDQMDHFHVTWTVLLQFPKRSLWMNRCCEDERSMIRNEEKSSVTYNQVGHSTLVMFCTFLFLTFVFFSCPGSSKDKKSEREFYIDVRAVAMFYFYNNNHKSIETNTQPSRAINLLTLLHFCIFRCNSGSGGQWVSDW